MTEHELRLLARNFRARAAEILVKAEAMTDADAHSQMRDVAVRYLLLAQQLEDDSA